MNKYDSPPVSSRPAARAGLARQLGSAALLLPAGLATAGAVLAGRGPAAYRRWLRAFDLTGTGHRPGTGAMIGSAAMSVLLGVAALVPVMAEVLFLLRGVLYGLVDHGPYDTSWGGPSMAGAWLAHLAISLPFAVGALGALWGLWRLQGRLVARLSGRRVGAWVVPVALLVCAAATLLVVAWTRQV